MRTLLILCLLAITAIQASAWSGPLQGPQISTRSAVDATGKKKVRELHSFMTTEMEFLSGRFFNQSNQFSLGGTMDQAATCVRMISEAKLWTVDVTEHNFGENKKAALSIRQLGFDDSLSVVVNSGRGDYVRKNFERFLTPKKPAPVDTTLLALRKLATTPIPDADSEAKGLALAKNDIAAKQTRILYYGKPRAIKEPHIDKASGLPLVAAAGCCVSGSFVKAVEAYNKAMRDSIAPAETE